MYRKHYFYIISIWISFSLLISGCEDGNGHSVQIDTPDEPNNGSTNPDESNNGSTNPDESNNGSTNSDEPNNGSTNPDEPNNGSTNPDDPNHSDDDLNTNADVPFKFQTVDVPAGTYQVDQDTSIEMPHFKIMKYEASAFQYGLCITHGKCSLSSFISDDSDCIPLNDINNGATDARLEDERNTKPVNCIKYQGAQEFCQWLGGRLPTEHEWEYAASGGQDIIYPWGNEEPEFCIHASYADPLEQSCCKGVGEYFSKVTSEYDSQPGDVNTYEAGQTASGIYQMAGTLAEYTEGVNIAPPEEYCCRETYILKGGSFASFPEYLAIRSREVLCDCHYMTTIPYSRVGIRCIFDK